MRSDEECDLVSRREFERDSNKSLAALQRLGDGSRSIAVGEEDESVLAERSIAVGEEDQSVLAEGQRASVRSGMPECAETVKGNYLNITDNLWI